MKKRIHTLVGLLFWVLMVSAAAADNDKMTHIIFRNIDPGLQEHDPASSPKEMWRVGNRYLRLEEPPDPEKGIHGLIIVDEPHAFMINRYNNEGQHIIDPGPKFEVHAPLFSFPDSSEISRLEFGQEREFFEKHKAQSLPDVNTGDAHYKAYMLEMEGGSLILFTDEKTGQPAQVAFQSEKDSYIIRYETFESGLEPDWNLFKVPAGVKIYEAKQ